MKRKTKIITASVSVVCVLLVAVGVVLAYMTDNRDKANSFTVGYDSIEIIEDFAAPPAQSTETIYKKQVQIKNNGNVPCYIRVYADFSDSSIRNGSYFSNSDDSTVGPYFSADRDTTNTNSYVNNLPEGWAFVPDNDTNNPALAGYYYYTKPVQPNESTPTLFKYIKTNYTTDENEIRQYDVMIYAESVQTVLKDGSQASSYSQAWSEFLS